MISIKEPVTVQELTVPTLDLCVPIVYQPLRIESQNSVFSVKLETCPSPISRIANEVPEPEPVKSEILSPLSSPANPDSVKNEDTSCSAIASPALTTELENFQDLTEWCHRAPKTPNMSFPTETDELNTPVPELGDFWFTSPTTIDHTHDDCYGLLNVLESPEFYSNVETDIQSNKFNDLDSQIFGESSNNFNNIKSETYKYSNVISGGGEVQESVKTKDVTYMNNNYNNVYTDIMNSGLNQEASVSFDSKSTTNIQSSSTGIMSQENTKNVFSFTPSTSQFYELPVDTTVNNTQEFITFPLANVAPQTSTERKPLPRLDFSNIWVDNKQIMSTPEVINTALSLDTGFNLVNFITEENVVAEEVSPSRITAEVEEDSQSHCPPSNDPDPLYTPSEASDEDDEYEPPWKKQKSSSRSQTKQKKQKSVLRFDQDSETSNASTVESVKVARRGRPPKRNISVCSDSNTDPEMSRYRELRDKNNEASRRSRLNRKKKETEMEQEAKDLDARNRKLKVRVQELERLLNTMRNNLMQVMLLKK